MPRKLAYTTVDNLLRLPIAVRQAFQVVVKIADKSLLNIHYTHYTCVLNTYSHRERRREERWLEGQQFTKQGRKCQHV